MTDDPTPTADEPTDEHHASSWTDEDDTATARRMVRYAQWAAFAVLVLAALLAAVRLYGSVSATIHTFITRRYRPLFMTGFNLIVLLTCAVGLSALVRRLT